jgi:hypothetical protein
VRRFLDQYLPQPYRHADGSPDPEDAFTVDRMQAPDGRELAVIVRRSPVGRPTDRLDIVLDWRRSHTRFTLLDPFAVVGVETQHVDEPASSQSSLSLAGYQDVMLVLAE